MMLNPWRSMWTSPKNTIREIVSENPNYFVWFFSFIVGFSHLLGFFGVLYFSLGIVPILLGLVVSPLIGYLVFAIWGGVLLFTGKMFKGQASFREIRAAQAWSSLPLAVNLILSVSSVFLLYGLWNMGSMHVIEWIMLLFALGRLVFAVWSLVLFVGAVAEVQRFSVLRSIGNFVAATLLVTFVVLTLCLIAGFFVRS